MTKIYKKKFLQIIEFDEFETVSLLSGWTKCIKIANHTRVDSVDFVVLVQSYFNFVCMNDS